MELSYSDWSDHCSLLRQFKYGFSELPRYLAKVRYDGYTHNSLASVTQIDATTGFAKTYVRSEKLIDNFPFALPREIHLPPLVQALQAGPAPLLPVPCPPKRLYKEQLPAFLKDSTTLFSEALDDAIWDQVAATKQLVEETKAAYLERQAAVSRHGQTLFKALTQGAITPTLVENSLQFIFHKHFIPGFMERLPKLSIEPGSRIGVLDIQFPDYGRDQFPIDFTSAGNTKYSTAANRGKYIRKSVLSAAIFYAHLVARYAVGDLFDVLVVNVQQDWFDPATGQPRSGTIASVQAEMAYLRELNLAQLDPLACFKQLKGLATPAFDNVSPIRPIMTLQKGDARFVESRDVAEELAIDTNLAAMDWEEFEHLIAQLFEWEFAKDGVEIKVTRASRDRGVDAVLFDPNPLRGGKYVVQAKRYTRTVDVSAVRDLYGTVMNEGANRGILITTASYGPDSYEFAKDKPISLVDGPNLLNMLHRHGKSFRIDLEEARLMMSAAA